MNKIEKKAIKCCINIFNDCNEKNYHLMPEVMQDAWKVGKIASENETKQKMRCKKCWQIHWNSNYCYRIIERNDELDYFID